MKTEVWLHKEGFELFTFDYDGDDIIAKYDETNAKFTFVGAGRFAKKRKFPKNLVKRFKYLGVL
jgi:hypothetical protein